MEFQVPQLIYSPNDGDEHFVERYVLSASRIDGSPSTVATILGEQNPKISITILFDIPIRNIYTSP